VLFDKNKTFKLVFRVIFMGYKIGWDFRLDNSFGQARRDLGESERVHVSLKYENGRVDEWSLLPSQLETLMKINDGGNGEYHPGGPEREILEEVPTAFCSSPDENGLVKLGKNAKSMNFTLVKIVKN
jgi:hypothetical protein